MAGSVRRRQRKPRIGFARFGDDLHALLTREMHHRRVFGEAVHEKRAHAPIAGAQVGARKKRTAEALAAMPLENGKAELGVRVGTRKMRCAKEPQLIVEYAEEGVALEVDALDIGANGRVVDRCTKTQPPVLGIERSQMTLERAALERGKLSHQNVGTHAGYDITSRALRA